MPELFTQSFVLPIKIQIKPPRWLAAFFLIEHLGAVIILYCVKIHTWAVISLSVLLVINCIYLFNLYIWQKSEWSPMEIFLNHQEEWRLLLGNGTYENVRLCEGYFVHPLLIILKFKYKQGLFYSTIILTPDVINPEELRKLRVRLRFRRNIA